MKRNEEQFNSQQFRPFQDKYRPRLRETDPDWQFQKVQSVYQVAKDAMRNGFQHNQPYHQNEIYRKYAFQKGNYQSKKVQFQRDEQLDRKRQQANAYGEQRQIFSRNQSSKSNSETNIVSRNDSLEYLSSQEPSFSNKGEFTVFEDFNIEGLSPVKGQQRPLYLAKNLRPSQDIASFSSGNNRQLSLKEKFIKLYEFVQELKFMKEGFESKLKQQKVNFSNQIQQLKKLLFKLNIKYEKEILEFSKKQSRPLSRQASIRQSGIKEDQNFSKELLQLKNYCQHLQDEKFKSQQKYQTTLKKYQQEIQSISEEFERKLNLQKSSHFGNPEFQQSQCLNCLKFQQESKQKKGIQSYEIQIWKNRLREQQDNHNLAMKRLQEKVFVLQEQFQYLEKEKVDAQRTFKQKEKQIVYRQAEIQYKFKDIERRQREIQMSQSVLQKQRDQLERKKQKIADFELKVMKQERRQKTETKEKQMMSSEYFNNCQKKRLLSKGNPPVQRSDSVSSRGSKIDINARLREIQMMRNKGQRNYDENITSRNSSRDSRTSGSKDYTTSRVTLSSRNLKDYGISPPLAPQKEYRENTQTIKLSQKLNRLTQTLQKQLRDMD